MCLSASFPLKAFWVQLAPDLVCGKPELRGNVCATKVIPGFAPYLASLGRHHRTVPQVEQIVPSPAGDSSLQTWSGCSTPSIHSAVGL